MVGDLLVVFVVSVLSCPHRPHSGRCGGVGWLNTHVQSATSRAVLFGMIAQHGHRSVGRTGICWLEITGKPLRPL
jgi:hypothetical protein